MKMLVTILLILAVAFAAGCTPAKRTGTSRAASSAPYDFKKEGTIPPVAPEKRASEDPDVEEVAIEETPLEIEEADAPIDTTRSEPVRTMMEGFRVQVFATGAEDVANTARYAAEARLGVEAHVEVVDGIYKVRVGDCKTREDAEVLLARCQEGFYKDAWIVECMVYVKRRKPASQQD